jgi:ubiquinone/menaquinone biosynthesis C-methylase UbiE
MYFADFLRRERLFKGLLVDLGCGSGADVEIFARYGINAMGVDYSQQEVRAATMRYPQLRFEQQDMESLTFANDSIGSLYTVNVMHYVDQRRALAEMFRVLQPGGFVYVHFNEKIVDTATRHIDFSQDYDEIMGLVSCFSSFHPRNQLTTREDLVPVPHEHYIRELILEKPQ